MRVSQSCSAILHACHLKFNTPSFYRKVAATATVVTVSSKVFFYFYCYPLSCYLLVHKTSIILTNLTSNYWLFDLLQVLFEYFFAPSSIVVVVIVAGIP